LLAWQLALSIASIQPGPKGLSTTFTLHAEGENLYKPGKGAKPVKTGQKVTNVSPAQMPEHQIGIFIKFENVSAMEFR
jgi:hypothetical protein